MYDFFVYPYFVYCVHVWVKHCFKLRMSEYNAKSIVRIIERVSAKQHTAPLFVKFKILRLHQLVGCVPNKSMLVIQPDPLPCVVAG